MIVKIKMEMNGNDYLNLLRKVPKQVAHDLKCAAELTAEVYDRDDLKLVLENSASEIIEAKKR